MIINLTQPRQYICQYMNNGKPCSLKFIPGDNKIPSSEVKALLAHPGIKRKIDIGMLVVKNSVTEDLSKAAAEAPSRGRGRPPAAPKTPEAGDDS